MVLQVGAHAGTVFDHRNAVLLQQRCRADARKLEQLCGANAAGAQDHLTLGRCGDHLMTAPDLHAGATLAAVGLLLDLQAGHLGRGPHLEIGTAVAGRAQERLGRVPAPTAFLVHFEVAHALVVAAVEVVCGRNAGLLRGLGKGVKHIPAQALLLDPPFAPGLVVAQQGAVAVSRLALEIHQLGGNTLGAVQCVGAFVIVLMVLEVGQGIVPAPGLVARQLRPLVVVARLAAHVDHAVDARAATQHLAARVAQRAAVQAGVGLGVVKPVSAGVADAVEVAHWNVDPVVVIAATGLDQQHALAGVGAEPVGQQAAGGTGADDDVVEMGVVHGLYGGYLN